MYLQKFEGEGGRLLQGAVRFPVLPSDPQWWRFFTRRAALVSASGEVATVFRMSVSAKGDASALLSVTVREEHEQRLRAYLSGFAWLEGFASGSVELAGDATAFSAWADAVPPVAVRLNSPKLSTGGGVWMASGMAVAQQVASLLQEAQAFGYAFAYQATFRPFVPELDLLRRSGRNLIALRELAGASAAVIADQSLRVEQLKAATLLIEECVATDSTPSATDWLTGSLIRRLSTPLLRLTPQDLVFAPVAELDEIALLMPASLLYATPLEDDELCSQAASEVQRAKVFGIRPPDKLMARPRSGDAEPPPAPFPPDTPPLPPSPGSRHAFISYKRSDIDRIRPVMELLRGSNLPFWYDAGIAVGDDWVETLELKIEQSAVMIAFLSPTAVESKYCRREIMFADALNKPLFPVLLEPVDLRHGLHFTLQTRQQLKLDAPDFARRLVAQIEPYFIR